MENNGQAESNKKSGSSGVKQCFSRLEAAYYLGVSVITIDRALAGEKVGCYRIGRRIVFSQQHLDEFLSRNECKAKVKGKSRRKTDWFSDGEELAMAE